MAVLWQVVWETLIQKNKLDQTFLIAAPSDDGVDGYGLAGSVARAMLSQNIAMGNGPSKLVFCGVGVPLVRRVSPSEVDRSGLGYGTLFLVVTRVWIIVRCVDRPDRSHARRTQSQSAARPRGHDQRLQRVDVSRRDLIVLCAFCVVLGTLVIQGFTIERVPRTRHRHAGGGSEKSL
jgi:hypothetical protein